jgi:dipeptidyl-peptidase-3
MFDPSVDTKRVNLDSKKDLIAGSANNFYEDGITNKEVDAYYANVIDKNDGEPISYGLNSTMVKKDGKLMEDVWKTDGRYGGAIQEMVKWLTEAKKYAESESMNKGFDLLIKYYQTGDLKVWDEYNIVWASTTSDAIDYINGFIEVYGDAKGFRGTYESIIQISDFDASERMKVVADNAQYFEDNSSIMDEHKKENVTGVSYKVVNVAIESGDASPSTPIGVNLPNANWIRAKHGSKSVSLGNIVEAYDNSSGASYLEEFAYSQEEIDRAKAHSKIASKLHTALHEVIGHASGKLNPGVGTPKETLVNYASTLEEARADLVALFYLMDPKLVELGLMESLEVGKAEYDSYIRNGMMVQMRRIEEGENIEEAHMRNRQLVAKWVFEKGAAENVVERKQKDGKTFFVINDYDKLKILFGDLLREIQRIKSEGDFEAGMALVENYGVLVDKELHLEVLKRSESLGIAPYGGFINPNYEATMDENGNITDVKISYPDDFVEQMLYYGNNYSFLN